MQMSQRVLPIPGAEREFAFKVANTSSLTPSGNVKTPVPDGEWRGCGSGGGGAGFDGLEFLPAGVECRDALASGF